MNKRLIKVVSLILTATVAISASGCNSANVYVPDYDSKKVVDFVAYGSPTNPNWDGSKGNADGLTIESYRLLAEGGFTQCQALYEGYLKTGGSIEEQSAKAEQDALKALALCEQVERETGRKLKYSVRDWTFLGLVTKENIDPNDYDSILEKMFSKDNPYINSPYYAGNNLHDEPTIQYLNKLVPVVDKYKELVPHGDCFINLNPIYATLFQLD